MNTQKSVYNRLFSEPKKTELESQKIELSLIDDAKKILTKVKKDLKEINSKGEKANTLYEEVGNLGRNTLSVFNKLEKFSSSIKKMSLDLGVKPPKEVQELDEAIDDILTYRKRYNF